MTSIHRRAARGIAVAALATVGLVALGWWWTHPKLFHDLGYAESMGVPVPVARATFYEGVVFPPTSGGAAVDLTSASAHFTTNSAGARATFVVCHDGNIGLVSAPLSRYCHGTTALPSRFHYLHGSRDSLVMAVIATHPGRVHIDKVTLDYRRGADGFWRDGKQTIAAELTFTAR